VEELGVSGTGTTLTAMTGLAQLVVMSLTRDAAQPNLPVLAVEKRRETEA